jgi:hypothetical protein
MGIGEQARTEANEIIGLSVDGELDFVHGEGASTTILISVPQIRFPEGHDPWLGIALRVYGERIPECSVA